MDRVSGSGVIQKDIVNELHGGGLATKRTAENIEAAQTKVNSLKEKLEKYTNKQKAPKSAASIGDWTNIYAVCNDFEDVQEIEQAVEEESKRLRELSENALLSAHQHDHADVRPRCHVIRHD